MASTNTGLLQELKDLWEKRNISSIAALKTSVDSNPYYPFLRVGDTNFSLQRRYPELYQSFVLLCICSLMLLLVPLTVGIGSSFFPCCVVVWIYSVCELWTFKHPRRFILEGAKKTCTCVIGRNTVVVDYHNIYIRLRRARGRRGRTQFQLIFNGQHLEPEVICRPTRQVRQLREIGQRIAENLNINYFDELNMSRFHVVRHERESEGVTELP